MAFKYEPTVKYENIKNVKNDKLDKDAILSYLHCLLTDPRQNITKSQEIETYNNLVTSGIQYIITELFSLSKTIPNKKDKSKPNNDNDIKSYTIQIQFSNVEIDTPKIVDKSGDKIPAFPDYYRASGGFYSADIILDIETKITALYDNEKTETKSGKIQRISISSIPVMVKSIKCNTFGLPEPALKGKNEDPNDTGGYFIVNGGERVLVGTDNIAYNRPIITMATDKTQKITSMIISQGGDSIFGNSTSLYIHYTQDGSIVAELQTYLFENLQIPFYSIYRAFDMLSDQDIFESIIYDHEDNTDEIVKMKELLKNAFEAKYSMIKRGDNITSSTDILNMFDITNNPENVADYKKDPETVRFAQQKMRDSLDRSILPHIGTTSEFRSTKLLYISEIIRNILKVEIGTRKPDDRDHYVNKRIHGSGVSLSKALKTLFSSKVATPLIGILTNEVNEKIFNNLSINDINHRIKENLSSKELENAFIKHIMLSDKDNTRVKEKIRINAQVLERKNVLNVIVTLRTIVAVVSTVAKSTKRSDAIRYWHPSCEGIIGPFHSPEGGDKVGTTKQLALTAFVTNQHLTADFKAYVRNDPAVILSKNVSPVDIPKKNLTIIYVDGDWVACVENPHEFVKRYRLLRREGVINRFTSIEFDTYSNIISFSADIGRIVRPLLIVDNNLHEINEWSDKLMEASKSFSKSEMEQKQNDWIMKNPRPEFVQSIRLSNKDIDDIRADKLSFEDMIQRGYVEYIYPGEEVLLCPDIQQLVEDRNKITKQWTHCDVPQALYSPATLTGPYLDRNQPFRNTLVQIHAKQACGQPITNIQTATRRGQRFHMNQVDVPLVKTITKDIFPPNSQNTLVLYSVYHGHNQEDSSIYNKGSVERGLLKGVYFKVENIEVDKNMIIRTPNSNDTEHIRSTGYSKLQNDGMVAIGTTLNKGDIMLGRVVELANHIKGKKYLDKSVPYDMEEPGLVVAISSRTDSDDQKFVSITFEYIRPMSIGDKASSRAGNKNILAKLVPSQDMPYIKETGVRPDVILNPHSVPTRMTLAQMFECVIAKIAVKKGAFIDATVYSRFDTTELLAELTRLGVAVNETLIDGATGEEFEVTMFMGPQTTIRLPKFVLEDRHAVGSTGPRNQVNGQALTGKRSGGGAKNGEMELHVMLNHGAMSSLYEEFFHYSDAFKVHVCRTCNELASYNKEKNIYKCTNKDCKLTNICELGSSRTSLVFNHELHSCNIAMKLIPEPIKYETY